jgi:hypothetical protein
VLPRLQYTRFLPCVDFRTRLTQKFLCGWLLTPQRELLFVVFLFMAIVFISSSKLTGMGEAFRSCVEKAGLVWRNSAEDSVGRSRMMKSVVPRLPFFRGKTKMTSQYRMDWDIWNHRKKKGFNRVSRVSRVLRRRRIGSFRPPSGTDSTVQ